MIRIENDGTGRSVIVSDEADAGRPGYSLVVDMLSLNLADGSVTYAGARLDSRDVPMIEHFLDKRGVPAPNVFHGEPES